MKLPKHNVDFAVSGQELTPEAIKGMICNPIYAGVGPYPAIMSDEEWVRAASKSIKEDGPEQFLVNMLYVMRASLPGAE